MVVVRLIAVCWKMAVATRTLLLLFADVTDNVNRLTSTICTFYSSYTISISIDMLSPLPTRSLGNIDKKASSKKRRVLIHNSIFN